MTKDLTWIAAFALVCTGILFLLPTPHASPGAIVIEDVLLFDGERFREGRHVLIEDGRIVEVGSAVRPPIGAQRIDGAGKTLLPGLIDAHTHTWGDGLRDALRFGVTTQIDMFTDVDFFAEARKRRVSTEPTDQADLFSAGTLVTVAGGHGTQFGLPIATLDSADGADAFVAARKAEGSDFIKLVIEDGSAYGHPLPTLDVERVREVVRAAHERDLLAVAHVSTLADAKMVIDAGVDGLVHIFHDEVIDDTLLADLEEREVFVIPTLAVIAGFADRAGEARADGDPRLSGAQNASLYSSPSGEHDGASERALESVRLLHAAGVPILAGTDAPNTGTAHGASLHDELVLLRRAGLDTTTALAAATSLPAKWFRLGARGRVQPEMRADLLLLDGDPRADLSATTRIVTVIKNGHIVPPSRARAVAATAVSAATISDFERAEVEASVGFGWQETTDKIAGGKSAVTFESVREPDNGFVRVSATVAPGFPYPWAGLIYFPGEHPMAPVDATGIDAVRFRARGDTGSYRLMFFVEGQTMPVMRQFEVGSEWREVSIGLDAVSDPGRLTAIAWVAGPAHGDYSFDLDDVRLDSGL